MSLDRPHDYSSAVNHLCDHCISFGPRMALGCGVEGISDLDQMLTEVEHTGGVPDLESAASLCQLGLDPTLAGTLEVLADAPLEPAQGGVVTDSRQQGQTGADGGSGRDISQSDQPGLYITPGDPITPVTKSSDTCGVARLDPACLDKRSLQGRQGLAELPCTLGVLGLSTETSYHLFKSVPRLGTDQSARPGSHQKDGRQTEGKPRPERPERPTPGPAQTPQLTSFTTPDPGQKRYLDPSPTPAATDLATRALTFQLQRVTALRTRERAGHPPSPSPQFGRTDGC